MSEEDFFDKIENIVERNVRDIAGETIFKNVSEDKSRPRYASVPSGGACPYCEMIASRGFVYVNEDTVDASHHDHCQCVAVPGWGDNPQVDGYDPDAYYQSYLANQKAKELIEEAASHDKVVTGELGDIASKTKTKLTGLEFRIKSEESLSRKLLTSGVDAQMKDVLRYTSISDEKNLVESYGTFIEELKEKGYNVSGVKNYWLEPTSAYKGINTNIITPDGYEFELQFHTEHSLEIKEEMHSVYEEFRALNPVTDDEKMSILKDEMFKISEKNIFPDDVESIHEKLR